MTATAVGRQPLSAIKRLLLCTNISFSILLNIANVEAIVIPLPAIQRSLAIETSQLQWTISAYSVGYGAFLLLAGRLSDVFGAKKVYMSGYAMFAIWSLAVGFAPNMIGLFVMRALQGASAAFTIPSGISILGSNFAPGPAKSWAFASYSAAAALGLSLGSIVGGIVTQYTRPEWRTIFFISAGIAAGFTAQAYFVIPPDVSANLADNSVDWIGAALIVSGLVLFIFGLAQSETADRGWSTPYIPALFVVGCVLMATFWIWEWRRERKAEHPPLMITSLWKRGRFAAIQGVAFLSWSAFTVQEYYAVLYYQQYEGLDAIQTTIRFLPMAVSGVIVNILVGATVSKISAQFWLVLGATGTALAPLLFAVQDPDATYWSYQFVAMVTTTLGADCSYTVGLLIGSDVAGEEHQGIAGGVFNTMNQLGTAVGLAIMTIIYDRVLEREARSAGIPYDHGIENTVGSPVVFKALQAAFYGTAAFGIVCLLFSIVCFIGIGRVSPEGGEAPPSIEKPSDEEAPPTQAEDRDGEQTGETIAGQTQTTDRPIEK